MQLPVAVLGVLGERPADVGAGDVSGEPQHAVLVLNHRPPFWPRTRYGRDMTADPRAALATLVAALERHLEAAASKSGEDDPTVVAAYEDVAEAFEAYDDACSTPTAR